MFSWWQLYSATADNMGTCTWEGLKRMLFYYKHKHTAEGYWSEYLALWGQFPPRRLLGVDRK